MSKKLILKASVAALMGTALVSTAHADGHDAKVTFSGVVQAHVYLADDYQVDVTDDAGDVVGSEDADARVAAGDVRLQAYASDTVGGVEGYGRYRIDADGLSGTTLTADSITVGLKGSFGDIHLGETVVPTDMGQLANDIYDIRGDISDAVGYKGSFGPVTLGLAFSPEANSDVGSAGVQYSGGGFTVGAGFDSGSGDEDSGSAIGASYSFGGSSIAAHLASRGDFEVTSVHATTSFGGFGLALTHSVSDNESSTTRFNVSKGITEGLSWAARVQSTSPEEGDSSSFVRTSLTYSF